MPTAFNMVPDRFDDGRHLALGSGLVACGFDLTTGAPPARGVEAGDVVATWNLHGGRGKICADATVHGAKVLVMEEGYTRRLARAEYFALGLGGHHLSGVGPSTPDWPRLANLRLPIRPWRAAGDHILVCGQRGIGSRIMASPSGWHDDVTTRLKAITDRPIVVREHPGKRWVDAIALADQLKDAWACVVWASNCAVTALVMGIPVIYEAPHLVVGEACGGFIQTVEHPWMPDRLPALGRMAAAQFTLVEIASGEAVAKVLAWT